MNSTSRKKFRLLIWTVAFCAASGMCGFWYWSVIPPGPLSAGPGSQEDERVVRLTTASLKSPGKAAPALSLDSAPAIRQVLDESLAYRERLAALRSFPSEISPADRNALVAFLRRAGPQDESPWGASLKNEIMNQLCQWDAPGLHELFTAIYEDKNQSNVIRDYAVQHLIEYYRLRIETGDRELQNSELKQVARVLWQAVMETDSSIGGTALMGLSRLSDKAPEFDRERVAAMANQLAGDSGTGPFARTAAVQVCARMNVTDALPAIWQTAQSDGSVALRTSAIAALGIMDQTNAVPWLSDVADSGEDYLKPAATQALRQIALLERQKAKAIQDELDRQKGEELKRQKEARRSAGTL